MQTNGISKMSAPRWKASDEIYEITRHIHLAGGQLDCSPDQRRFFDILSEVVSDKRIPVDALYKIATLACLAWKVGNEDAARY